MNKELTFILEPDRGKLTIEVGGVSTDDLAALRANFDSPHNVNCGKPLDVDNSKPANQIDAFSDDQSFICCSVYTTVPSLMAGSAKRSPSGGLFDSMFRLLCTRNSR